MNGAAPGPCDGDQCQWTFKNGAWSPDKPQCNDTLTCNCENPNNLGLVGMEEDIFIAPCFAIKPTRKP